MPATPRSSAAPISTRPARYPRSTRVEAFLKDRDSDKRAKLVDRLLDSPEYVDYWAYKWSDLLLVSSRQTPSPGDVVVLPVRPRERREESSRGTNSPDRS